MISDGDPSSLGTGGLTSGAFGFADGQTGAPSVGVGVCTGSGLAWEEGVGDNCGRLVAGVGLNGLSGVALEVTEGEDVRAGAVVDVQAAHKMLNRRTHSRR